MKTSLASLSWIASALLVGILSAREPAPANKEASGRIRQAMAQSTSVSVYEGLPHQSLERDLLAAESRRKDTEKIDSFRFYTPAVAATNPELLKRILSSSDTIQVFRGEKLCGGFHPDYAVIISDDKGAKFHAQICFGCHEIIYSDGNNQYRYNLTEAATGDLRNALASYANKRPKRNANKP